MFWPRNTHSSLPLLQFFLSSEVVVYVTSGGAGVGSMKRGLACSTDYFCWTAAATLTFGDLKNF